VAADVLTRLPKLNSYCNDTDYVLDQPSLGTLPNLTDLSVHIYYDDLSAVLERVPNLKRLDIFVEAETAIPKGWFFGVSNFWGPSSDFTGFVQIVSSIK